MNLLFSLFSPGFEKSESLWHDDVRSTQKLNLQDQEIPLYPAAHSKPVQHDWSYQQLLQLWLINWNGGVISTLYQNMLRPNTSYKIIPECTRLGTTSFKQQQVTVVSNQYTSCAWRMEFSLDRWFCTADYTRTAEPIFHTLCFTRTTQFLFLTTFFKIRDTSYKMSSQCTLNV